MDLPPEFAEILDAAERLSRAEQEKLVAILQRRHTEDDRRALEEQVARVRHEFAEGQYRLVPIPQLLFERADFFASLDKYLTATQYSHPQRLMIRTQAFADDLFRFWESDRIRAFDPFELPELVDQLAAEAIKLTLPTWRFQGRNRCQVWSPHINLQILFDHVEHDRQRSILLLTIRRSPPSLY